MKNFMLMSTAMASLMCGSHAHAAIVPESNAEISACRTWAETHLGTTNYEPAWQRCLDLQNCKENRSANENTWRECVYRAENNYSRQISGEHIQKVATPFQADSPIVTENVDSRYENRTGKGFSFDDAAQGD